MFLIEILKKKRNFIKKKRNENEIIIKIETKIEIEIIHDRSNDFLIFEIYKNFKRLRKTFQKIFIL